MAPTNLTDQGSLSVRVLETRGKVSKYTDSYQIHQPGNSMPQHVTITKHEHETLLQKARDFEALKAALYRGGVTSETLDLLIQQPVRKDSGLASADWATLAEDETQAYLPGWYHPFQPSFLDNNSHTRNPLPGTYDPSEHSSTAFQRAALQVQQEASICHKHSAANHLLNPSTGDRNSSDLSLEHFQGDAARKDSTLGTLKITGLSQHITYKHLTDVIRGGPVISIQIHRKDRIAIVAMIRGALDFLHHVKRHDLYVQMKRLEVTWSNRQYRLSDHIRHQVVNGVTRNLAIRNAAGRVNEETIRHDLEHIDNLVIISIEVRASDIHIHTNSVHCAMFARTCMSSRKTYRSFRIEYFHDDCANPLTAPTSLSGQHEVLRSSNLSHRPSMSNIFDVLSLDSETDECDYALGLKRMDDSDSTIDYEGVNLDVY